jgi:AcrR family transcriptional regulator
MEKSRIDRLMRAEHILDTARELLLRWGYRRVTVDELARRAGVGKGTVYLHWRSREDVFHAVSAREAAGMTDAVVAAMRADSAEVALHRYLRRLFVEAMNRPVLRALYTGDAEMLDNFLAVASHRRLEEAKLAVNRDYLGILQAQKLLREDVRGQHFDYTLPVIVFGFFAAEPLLPAGVELTLEQKADQLADTVRCAFEPVERPMPQQLKNAATQAIPVFERLAHNYRSTVYGEDGDV